MLPADDQAKRIYEEYFTSMQGVYAATIEARARAEALPSDAREPEAIAFEVAMFAIEKRVPCPEWVAEATARAWKRFEDFEVESINEAFHIPPHKHVAARRSERLCAAMAHRVQDLQKQGRPLSSNQAVDGAFAVVGKEFNCSAATVEKRVKKWKELLAGESDTQCSIPDAAPVVYGAFARGLSE